MFAGNPGSSTSNFKLQGSVTFEILLCQEKLQSIHKFIYVTGELGPAYLAFPPVKSLWIISAPPLDVQYVVWTLYGTRQQKLTLEVYKWIRFSVMHLLCNCSCEKEPRTSLLFVPHPTPQNIKTFSAAQQTTTYRTIELHEAQIILWRLKVTLVKRYRGRKSI